MFLNNESETHLVNGTLGVYFRHDSGSSSSTSTTENNEGNEDNENMEAAKRIARLFGSVAEQRLAQPNKIDPVTGLPNSDFRNLTTQELRKKLQR